MTIADRIKNGPAAPAHTASMARMGAACVASASTGLTKGSAAAMTMLPVVPDYQRFTTGRDERETRGELGLRPLGEADAPLPLPLQGQGPSGLAADSE